MDAWRHVQRTDTNRSKSYPRTARYAAVAAVSVFGCQGPTGQSGGNSEEDPPVPMPNTEVKLFSVDDSRGFSPRESRSLPGELNRFPFRREAVFLYFFPFSLCYNKHTNHQEEGKLYGYFAYWGSCLECAI